MVYVSGGFWQSCLHNYNALLNPLANYIYPNSMDPAYYAFAVTHYATLRMQHS